MIPEVLYRTRIEPRPMNSNYKTGNEERRVITETIPVLKKDYQATPVYNSKC